MPSDIKEKANINYIRNLQASKEDAVVPCEYRK